MAPTTSGRALAMKRGRLLQRRGINLQERRVNPALLPPVPARLVVGQEGTVLRPWMNIDFNPRAEPTRIPDALQGLQARRLG